MAGGVQINIGKLSKIRSSQPETQNSVPCVLSVHYVW